MFVLSLLNDIEVHVALGFMSLPVIVHCIHLLAFEDAHLISSTLLFGWLLFHAMNFTSFAVPKLQSDVAWLVGKNLDFVNN